jgi:5'-nucleotidase
MHVTCRRAGALTVAVLTSVALGATALTGTTASASKPSGTTGRQAYAQLAPQKEYVKLDLLALNDFHGNLKVVDPTRSSSGCINGLA